jgi:hypothetical protein
VRTSLLASTAQNSFMRQYMLTRFCYFSPIFFKIGCPSSVDRSLNA